MPTKKERDTVCKLMLTVANAFDENRKETLPVGMHLRVE